MDIEWHLEKRKIADLKDHPKNPRKISKEQQEHLKTSLQKFGLIDKPIINLDNMLIGGHQRKNALKKLKQKEVECNVPSRLLTEKEVDELNIRLNKNLGEFDHEILQHWDKDELISYGFLEEDFKLDSSEITMDSIDEKDIALPDGEKGFETMSFTLTKDQVDTIKRALKISKEMGDFIETGNENGNGNALSRICELWMSQNGQM